MDLKKHKAIPIPLLIQILVVVASIGYAIYMQSRLPEMVPAYHGNILGQTDRSMVVWIGPGAELFLLSATLAGAFVLRSDQSAQAARPTILIVLLIATCFMAVQNVRTL